MSKLINNIFIALFTATMLFSLVSCSDDNDNNPNNSFIIINGEKCNIEGECMCSFHGRISSEDEEIVIPSHGSFSINPIFNESVYHFEFSINGLSSLDVVKVNENFVSNDNVKVDGFRCISTIELSTSYHSEDGSLSISEKGSNYVIVNFDNFSFIKDNGNRETKYTINGIVKFFDVNK